LSIVHHVVVLWPVQISKQFTPRLYQGSAKCSLLLLLVVVLLCVIIIIIIIIIAAINNITLLFNTIP